MAADDEAFDSLGRILAEGGLRSARAGLEKHPPGPLFTAWLATRFPGLRTQEVDQLSQLAIQYRAAGSLMQQLPADATLHDSIIPLAPQAFAPQYRLRKYYAQSMVRTYDPVSGKEGYFTVGEYWDEPIPIKQAIEALIEQTANEFIDKYKFAEQFGWDKAFQTIEISYMGVIRQW